MNFALTFMEKHDYKMPPQLLKEVAENVDTFRELPVYTTSQISRWSVAQDAIQKLKASKN